MIKGPGVMDGYHNLPEETAKTLTSDGWLHTGDKGALDEDGHLVITGRIKELFKTSGGKYIAPPAIESKFKAVCPTPASSWCSAEGKLVALAPSTPSDGRLGRGQRHEWRLLHRDRASDAVRGWSAATSTSSTATSTCWETIKKWKLPTTSRWSRASSPPR